MGSRRIINVQTRLFLLIVFFTWTLTLAFFMLQYTRESEFKVMSIDNRLQMVNTRVLEHLTDGGTVDQKFVSALAPGKDSLRVSIIKTDGRVIFDTNADSLTNNHSNRKEFKEAMANGHGTTVRRQSTADSREYFYSATRGNDVVVRSALPYTHTLTELLRVNSVDTYLIIAIAIIMTVIAWIATRSISRSVKNLRDFANEAEFGNIDDYETRRFPDDELGDISSHIVNLYKIMKEAAAERDKTLRKVIFEQREKNRIKHELTDNISHEFKTPVHVIQASLETIENNGDDLTPEMRKQLISTAYANVKRMCLLLDDLSVITRISDAPDRFGLEDVNVHDIITRVADDMKVYPPKQQMRIHIDVPNDVKIKGNPSLVESIFRNLMVNAFNYSGGRDVTVRMCGQTGDLYKFTFADNGIGVGEEHLGRLFERFYRVDKGRSRSMGGTGLGLAIVKNAVLFHRGTISVRNAERGGLEFTFTLHK